MLMMEGTNEYTTLQPKMIKGAVTGIGNAGKSAFINSFLNLYNDPKKASESEHGSAVAKDYKATDSTVQLTELPDMNLFFAPKFRYSNKFNLKQYDFFIVLLPPNNAPMDLNQWFISHIRNDLKKPFFCVKSKIDISLNELAVSEYDSPYSFLDDHKKNEIQQKVFQINNAVYSERIYFIGRQGTRAAVANTSPLMHSYQFEDLRTAIAEIIPTPHQEDFDYMKIFKDLTSKYIDSNQATGESIDVFLRMIEEKMNGADPVVRGAVAGSSGAGKSAFINSFCNLLQEKKAKEGIKQTTMEPTSYKSADKCLEMTDLPGVGTIDFPKDQYSTRFRLDKFDFIVCMLARDEERTTETDKTDKWLLNHLRRDLKKKVFVVQASVDEAIEKEVMATYNNLSINVNEEKKLQAHRKVFERKRHEFVRLTDQLFLIGRDPKDPAFPRHSYEFEKLMNAIMENLPKEKKRILVQGVKVCTDEWIKKKSELLDEYIRGYTGASIAAGLIPVPGVSVVIDVGLVSAFTLRCKRVYGLENDDLLQLPQATMIIGRIATMVLITIGVVAAGSATDDALKVIPLIGMAIGMAVGAAMAGPVMYGSLYALRRSFESVYRDVLQLRAEEKAANV